MKKTLLTLSLTLALLAPAVQADHHQKPQLGSLRRRPQQPRHRGQARRRLRPLRQRQLAGHLPAQGLRERLRLASTCSTTSPRRRSARSSRSWPSAPTSRPAATSRRSATTTPATWTRPRATPPASSRCSRCSTASAAIDSTADLIAAFGRADVDGTNAPVGVGLGVDRKDPEPLPRRRAASAASACRTRTTTSTRTRASSPSARPTSSTSRRCSASPASTAPMPARAPRRCSRWRPRWPSRSGTAPSAATATRPTTSASYADFKKTYPGFDWAALFAAQGMPIPTEVNVVTPSAVAPVLKIVADTPLATWRDYLRLPRRAQQRRPAQQGDRRRRASPSPAPCCSGQTAQTEPWKRAVATDRRHRRPRRGGRQASTSRATSRPSRRRRWTTLVANLRKALRTNIEQLDWMGAATKAEAFHKLDTFRPKIGYPSKWRDYSQRSTIVPDDLIANVMAMRQLLPRRHQQAASAPSPTATNGA